MNKVFLRHYNVLKAMHGYYCQFKHGARQPRMSIKEWDKFLKDADMYDEVRRPPDTRCVRDRRNCQCLTRLVAAPGAPSRTSRGKRRSSPFASARCS